MFVEKFAQPKNKENIKACITGILWVESINPTVVPHTNGQLCVKIFNVMMP